MRGRSRAAHKRESMQPTFVAHALVSRSHRHPRHRQIIIPPTFRQQHDEMLKNYRDRRASDPTTPLLTRSVGATVLIFGCCFSWHQSVGCLTLCAAQAVHRDGTLIPVIVNLTEIERQGRRTFTAWLRDQTESDAAQLAVRKRIEKLEDVTRRTHAGESPC